MCSGFLISYKVIVKNRDVVSRNNFTLYKNDYVQEAH